MGKSLKVVRITVLKVHPYLPQSAERVGVIWVDITTQTYIKKFQKKF